MNSGCTFHARFALLLYTTRVPFSQSITFFVLPILHPYCASHVADGRFNTTRVKLLSIFTTHLHYNLVMSFVVLAKFLDTPTQIFSSRIVHEHECTHGYVCTHLHCCVCKPQNLYTIVWYILMHNTHVYSTCGTQ